MTTDASQTGWGCTVNGIPTGGCWDPEEANRHINYLETMAVFLGLQSFSDQVSDKTCQSSGRQYNCHGMYKPNGHLPL